jgi:Cu/Zn superoxide dismutase
MPKAPWVSALALAAVWLAACGATPGGQGSDSSPSPSASASAAGTPSPSPKVFTFKLTPADSTVTAKGTITVTAGTKTTSIELKITGLTSSSSHISHVHLGSCAPTGRGGIAFALNQVIADGQGAADTKTTLSVKFPPATGKWYVVVHAGPDMQGTNSKYLLCGQLF